MPKFAIADEVIRERSNAWRAAKVALALGMLDSVLIAFAPTGEKAILIVGPANLIVTCVVIIGIVIAIRELFDVWLRRLAAFSLVALIAALTLPLVVMFLRS